MAGLIRLRFGPSRAQQRRYLYQRRFIFDRRRQPLLDRRALSPRSGQPSDLDATRYFHDRNTADGPR
jgi:hypothetical protein